MVKLTEALVLARSRASDLENVRKFNCWGSELSDISILQRMPNVQIVSLSVNKIHTLIDLSSCPNVEELYIRRNEIASLSEIHHLASLPKLRILWLADNPCAESEKYRLSVLRTLPNLQKLDNIVVSPEELNDAIENGLEVPKPGKSPPLAFEPRPLPPLPSNLPSNTEKQSQPEIVSASVDVGDVERNRSKFMHVGEKPTSPPVTMWEETNKIRQQLGLKPISIEKVTPMKPRVSSSAKSRNANLLQAVLHLVKELDAESLEIVNDAVRNRLENL